MATVTFAPQSIADMRINASALDQIFEPMESQIETDYSPWFCNNIGVERILSIPQVKAEDVNLQNDRDYPEGEVKPSMLKHSAVRGSTGNNRPFIALKIDVFHPKTKEKIDTVAVLVLKRYSNNHDGQDPIFRNNYRTMNAVSENRNISHNCNFFGSGMHTSLEHLHVVRDLLDGKEVQPSGCIIRLASG